MYNIDKIKCPKCNSKSLIIEDFSEEIDVEENRVHCLDCEFISDTFNSDSDELMDDFMNGEYFEVKEMYFN